jgi:cytochrome c biogenesis protein CcmG, thiol:disulfide interchange protein DsbE
MPLLQQAWAQESVKADGIVVLLVNVQDTAEGMKKFLEDNDYSLPSLVDSGGRVGRAYGISAIPITFFIGRDGLIRYVKRGMFLSINEVNVAMGRIR